MELAGIRAPLLREKGQPGISLLLIVFTFWLLGPAILATNKDVI